MRSHVAVLWSMLTVALVACYSAAKVPAATPAAEQVRVGKADPDPVCRDLGPIEIAHGKGCGAGGKLGSYQGAYNRLRNRAAKRGGTYVRMDSQTPPHDRVDCFDNRFIIRGVVYACPQQAVVAPQSATRSPADALIEIDAEADAASPAEADTAGEPLPDWADDEPLPDWADDPT